MRGQQPWSSVGGEVRQGTEVSRLWGLGFGGFGVQVYCPGLWGFGPQDLVASRGRTESTDILFLEEEVRCCFGARAGSCIRIHADQHPTSSP